MIPAKEALARLRAGNLRFVAGKQQQRTGIYAEQHADLVEGQQPFAIILGCSDSRVPAEMVFDQGFGSLFVIRVAGNIVAPSQIGSVEFAAQTFGTQLVVVLGHTQCGAIAGAINALSHPQGRYSPNLSSIVGRIRPAIKPLIDTDPGKEPDALQKAAVHANARASARDLVRGSPIIRESVASGDLLILSAEYSIETGKVTFLDDPDTSAHDGLPRRAADTPIAVDVQAGKKYFWCACGLSKNQPFCDGTHKGTAFNPVKYIAADTGKVFFCGCKRTGDQPLCDGSHKTTQT